MPHVPRSTSCSQDQEINITVNVADLTSRALGGILLWETAKDYVIGDLVYINNSSIVTVFANGIFLCTADHTSSAFDSDIANWKALTSAYVHEQSTPSTIWQVDHGLNRFPSVTIYDSLNKVIEAEVEYSTANRVFVNFNTTMVGSVYCV